MSVEEDFHEFVSARCSALLRTAYLLTGDRGRGEDLEFGGRPEPKVFGYQITNSW